MTTMVSPLFKKLGIIITILGIGVFITLHIWQPQYDKTDVNNEITSNIHFVIICGLMMLTFSREKMDDERVQIIRFYVTKFCFRFLIILIPVYINVTNLDRVPFSIYPVFYIIEGILILFQILFQIGLKTNPDFIFKEKMNRGDTGFLILFICLLILLAMIIINVITHLA